jgi:hypothetical protein
MSTQRSRSRVKVDKTAVMQFVSDAGTIVQPRNTIVAYQEEAMTDVVTDRYRSRVRNGEIINNALTYSSSVKASGTGSWIQNHNTSSSSYSLQGDGSVTYHALLDVGFVPTSLSVTLDDDKLVAVAKHHAIANIDSTPFDFFEDVLELSETIRFLRNPFTSINRILRVFNYRRSRLLKRNFRTEVLRVKALADLWAQYRFAVAPLLRSAMEAMEAYETKVFRPKRRTARGHASKSGSDFVVRSFGIGGGQTLGFDITAEAETSVHAVIIYEHDNPLASWQFKLGLRAKDLPATMWEILPLSFMVDRVVGIKNTIQGLTNLSDPSVKILAGNVSVRKTSSLSRKLSENSIPGWSVQLSGDTYVESDFTLNRSPWQPSLSDVVPRVQLEGLVRDVETTLDLIAITLGFIKV